MSHRTLIRWWARMHSFTLSFSEPIEIPSMSMWCIECSVNVPLIVYMCSKHAQRISHGNSIYGIKADIWVSIGHHHVPQKTSLMLREKFWNKLDFNWLLAATETEHWISEDSIPILFQNRTRRKIEVIGKVIIPYIYQNEMIRIQFFGNALLINYVIKGSCDFYVQSVPNVCT